MNQYKLQQTHPTQITPFNFERDIQSSDQRLEKISTFKFYCQIIELWKAIDCSIIIFRHPDAPANPLYEDLKCSLDSERDVPYDYQRAGKLKTMHIASQNQQIFNKSLLQTQKISLSTFNQLRNKRYINQMIERVYQGLRPHVDALKICIVRCRATAEADYCFDNYNHHFEAEFKPSLKNVLLDY